MGAIESAAHLGMGNARGMIATLSSGAIFAGMAVKAFTIVPQGERGFRTRRGEAIYRSGSREGQIRKFVQPGMHGLIPFTHSIRTISVLERHHRIHDLIVEDDSGRQTDIAAAIFWRVKDDEQSVYKSLYAAQDEETVARNVTSICASGIMRALYGQSREVMAQSPSIKSTVERNCGEDLDMYGAELRRITIEKVASTFGQMIVCASENNTQIPLHRFATFPQQSA